MTTINHSISEYGKIGYGLNIEKEKYKSASVKKYKFIKELKEFNENSSNNFFRIIDKNTLQAVNNYVGVIKTPNLNLEILPKIYKSGEEKKARNILNKMILKVYDLPREIEGTNANLESLKDMNIFEVFITLFANSVDELIKKGIKSDYIVQEDNLPYLKGKIQFSNHIRYNLAHKERFYVEFDEYMEDRVENRLLKTCIKKLLNISSDNRNQTMLREQLFFFDDVSYSTNIEYDISCIRDLHRGMEYYETPLKFAKIFLIDESFTPTRGDSESFSLLFPMANIFERYVEALLRENYKFTNLKTNIDYKNKEYLLSSINEKYKNIIGLEPDYTFCLNEKFIIADAKWKLIEETVDSNGNVKNEISSKDVYQLYTYMNYFDCDEAYIFAPKLTSIEAELPSEFQFNAYMHGIECRIPRKKLHIYYIDLESEIIDTKI